MTHPSGIYNAHGRLVADRHGAQLTLIQDPDTGASIWVTPTGRIHHISPPIVTGDQVDVDRLNRCLREDREQQLRDTADKVALVIIFGLAILICLLAVWHR